MKTSKRAYRVKILWLFILFYFIFAYVVLITHILVKICLMGWSYKTPLLYHM